MMINSFLLFAASVLEYSTHRSYINIYIGVVVVVVVVGAASSSVRSIL